MNNIAGHRDYKVIAISVLLAVFLWLMVKLSKNYDYALEIPLRVVNTNPELCLKYPLPETVRVVFLGKGSDLLRLKFYEIDYVVDVSEVKKRLVLNLTEHPEFVQFPEEITVTVKSVLSPQQIEFDFDRCAEKRVPVSLKFSLQTADGYTLVQAAAAPDSVVVKGPAVFVDTLTKVSTVFKSYRDVSYPFTENFQIKKNQQFFAEYLPSVLSVRFDVQRLAEKELDNVPVEVENVPASLEVVPLPSFVKVYVKGGERVLANARPQDFRVVIDFKRDWQPNKEKVKAGIQTRLNVLYAETIPSQFELIVQKKRNSSKE